MKKALKNIVIINLCISVLLGLCSCSLEESYKKFIIKNITENLNDDYFTSENFSFAKISDAVIIPEIREINHGEYIIYISAYSKNEKDIVRIKNLFLEQKESVLFSYKVNKEIELEKKEGNLYAGWTDGGTFTNNNLNVADGNEYKLVIEVEIIKSGECITDSITYEIVVKGYKSLVWPT